MRACDRCGVVPAEGERVYADETGFYCAACEADLYRRLWVAMSDLVATVWAELQRPLVRVAAWLTRLVTR